MITYISGDLMESPAEAMVNAVNTVGVMGKGIALLFKNKFPHNFKVYKKACNEHLFNIGDLIVTQEISGSQQKTIINLPTKTDWKKPAQYEYVEAGLKALEKLIRASGFKSLAIPALGVGNGGLDWEKVKELMELYLSGMDCEICIYEPQ